MNDTLFNYAASAPTSAGSFSSWMGIIVIGIVILILLIAMFIVMKRMTQREELYGMTREDIQRRWLEIEKVAATGTMGAKMAIIEADKLLDGTLKSMTMAGATLGERLRFACYKYPELRKVWQAHILRNQLVHETTFEVSSGRAREAIQQYKHALKVLKVL
jgi:hypothetical protein